MAADQDAKTHEDESNGHDEPIVGAKWAQIFWTVAIRPRPVVHLILRFIFFGVLALEIPLSGVSQKLPAASPRWPRSAAPRALWAVPPISSVCVTVIVPPPVTLAYTFTAILRRDILHGRDRCGGRHAGLEYEQHAAECRHMAAQMKNPKLKKRLEAASRGFLPMWDDHTGGLRVRPG
jgi:hypothetical protein